LGNVPAGQQECNTPAVREALLAAAVDEDEYVRAEAIWGLAHIDHDLALPLVEKALSADSVAATIFEAAELLAHPSLVDALRKFAEPTGNVYLDRVTKDALEACETGDMPHQLQRE
jgi:hypothetical protein